MNKIHQHPLQKILGSRIAIIDGAMGTTIRTYGMKESDVRGDRFKSATKDLLNNGDLFSLTQPAMIGTFIAVFLRPGRTLLRRTPSERQASLKVNSSSMILGSAEGERIPRFTVRSSMTRFSTTWHGDQRAVGTAVPGMG